MVSDIHGNLTALEAVVAEIESGVETAVAALRASGYPDADRIAEMLRRGRFVPLSPS